MNPTPISAGKQIRERGEFENAYHYLVEALQVLAQDAPTQCETMGNYNVAWELKDDVSRGALLFNYAGSARLTAEQKHGILDLVAALEAVPSTKLPAGSDPKDNLAAMNHSSWGPLRNRLRNYSNCWPLRLRNAGVIYPGNERLHPNPPLNTDAGHTPRAG